ncbi:MAG: hypothetical protein KKC24_24240 [Gammaproteobacteria bacterium]|nr:hypothetical protein [Gammaproteobacteria bacterium]MBU0821957.1 hypothetical protein [Gammaproteobacteria bacterium]MBU0844070.1 hypothetical protein [Gammaproteobacteria bacterium]MBU1842321.1 hypothetical protein [Gammaproteobacteria bacterium]
MKLTAVPPQEPLPDWLSASLKDRRLIGNDQIAEVFDEIADLLEIDDANPFRIRAYRNAARTLRALTFELAEIIARGEPLPKLTGIGVDLAGKINEIVTCGNCALRQRLRSTLPPGLVELLSIAGLGPKRVRHLYHDLGIETAQQLCEAARQGRIRHLPGFGEKMETRLLSAAQKGIGSDRRLPLAFVEPVAHRLIEYLQQLAGIEEATVAGSLRRMRDTVGDIDLLVAAAPSVNVTAHLLKHPEISTVLVKGRTRASVVLGSGLQVDMRIVKPAQFGAALVYFTGSKAHNIAIRQRARKLGLKLNEYGVFKAEECVARATEVAVYQALGLVWITPELREDRGEVEAALTGRLPRLIELSDLKGDLHAHTRDSDGGNSLELNSQPQRMDLFDLQCQYAKDQGVLISINSDAHRAADFSYLRYGVAQARRAWLEKHDVLNTRSLTSLKKFLRDGGGGRPQSAQN